MQRQAEVSIEETHSERGREMPTEPDVAADRVLLDALRTGDMRPLDALHRSYLVPVYWAAFDILRDRLDAEDVSQETFLTLWRRRHDIEIASSLLPWLLVTARYHALNRLRERSRRRRREAVMDDDLAAPDATEGNVFLNEQFAAVERTISRLPDLDRRIYRLCIEEGLLYKEAAHKLGVSHGTVRNRLSRVRLTLRRELGR